MQVDIIHYKKLYDLQDRVLSIVYATEREFYLTGGTCLSRFYQELRYSDDLDFFANNSNRYSFAVKNIKAALQQQNLQVAALVEAKNFVRLDIDTLLQVDFVNDTVPRYKNVRVLKNGYIIDTIENILSNKLTAIMGRDNPKDVFDICLISEFYTVNWKEILDNAHQKASFDDEDIIVRLQTFPLELLKTIKIKDSSFLVNFNQKLERAISIIIQASNNTENNL